MRSRYHRGPKSTLVVKRKIHRIIQKIEVLAGELEPLQEELEVPDFAELEEMCAGQRLWSYEALLLGLLGLMNFYLAEVTVSRWRESYAKYPPSRFDGDMYDPDLARAVRNWIGRKRKSFRAKARTQQSCSSSLTASTN